MLLSNRLAGKGRGRSSHPRPATGQTPVRCAADPARPLKSDNSARNNVTDGTTTSKVSICPASELPPGSTRLVEHDGRKIGIFNCEGTLHAIEDRCSHDDGPLAEGEFDPAACTVECPRHGSLFDLSTG